MVWQYKFIKNLVKYRSIIDETFVSNVNMNAHIMNMKNQYIPETLTKFYNPTFENLLDIKNRRLWMADPSSFNDPFDCKIGYNYGEFEKYIIIQHIIKNGFKEGLADYDRFTRKDLNSIYGTCISDPLPNRYSTKPYYSTIIRNILFSKSEQFQNEVNNMLFDKRRSIDQIIKEMKTTSVRISSFAGIQRWSSDVKKNLMWAHYASNHQGFCVEYDISSFRQETKYEIEWHNSYKSESLFIKERIEASIKSGLFPVRYNNKRVNIPKTLLDNIVKHKGELNLSTEQKIKEVILRAFITKSTAWNYEKEWRIIIDEQICKYYNYKIPFPYIKTIFIGCKANIELEKTLCELGEELNVDVVRMREDDSEFDLFEGNLDNNVTFKANPFI